MKDMYFFKTGVLILFFVIGVFTQLEGAWKIEIIEQDKVGTTSSIAIDSSDKIHICYYDETNKNLKYTTNKSGSWDSSVIDSSEDVGNPCSIAVDSNDKIHIAYDDNENENLKYASNVSGSWSIETIYEDVGISFVSLAIDSANNLHIGFGSGYLDYMTNTSGEWEWEGIKSADSAVLTVDSKGNAHAVSRRFLTSYNVFVYHTNASGSWVSEDLDYGSYPRDLGIAVDSSDNPHISYNYYDWDSINYTTNASGSWVYETIAQEKDNKGPGRYNAIVLDSNNIVHICYFHYGEKVLYCVDGVSGNWNEPVAVDEDDGRYHSIALDSKDNLHMSYYDYGTGELKYAYESADPDISVSPTKLDFGTVTVDKSSTKFVTITNDGEGELFIDNAYITGTNDDEFSDSSSCDSRYIEPGESCEVKVSFSPDSKGDKTATLNIKSDDPDSSTVEVDLEGTGEEEEVLEPDISVSTTSLNFGTVTVGATSSSKSVKVSNTGDVDLEVSYSITGADSSDFYVSSSTCSSDVSSGSYCYIYVKFSPNSEGSKSATFKIESNDPDESTVNISLSGTGEEEEDDSDSGDDGDNGSNDDDGDYNVGDVIESFDSPGPWSRGLTFDGTYLWNADSNDDKIYKLDTSGNIIDSFDSPGSYSRDLAYDGTYLWHVDWSADKIYKLDTNGNLIDSFDSPDSSPDGLTFDGTYLWHTDAGADKIYKLDTNGNEIDSFDSPGSVPEGLAYDGTYLWHADSNDGKIYKLDTSGNIIDSFDSPGSSPQGLAYDGTYLWNADFGDDKIYKIYIGENEDEGDGDDSNGMITDFFGITSDYTNDSDNYCFNAEEQTSFDWGDNIAFSLFWRDKAEADGVNEYEIEIEVTLPSGKEMDICSGSYEFTGLKSGAEYNFCFACTKQTPLSGNSGMTVEWEGDIEQVDEDDSATGVFNAITLD